ncbi:MAG: AAA family ATPase [Proteobacteria bacterium]|nr:AAA family ATPase [Pseudomonadota bacterium]
MAEAPSSSASPRGTARYRLEDRIGAGGMGVVYRARDLERDKLVALKMLSLTQPQALYRFKQEFRALADIRHANLVTLYEFHAEGDRWFFTMEYVDGRSLLAYVRGSEPQLEGPPTLWSDEPGERDVAGAPPLGPASIVTSDQTAVRAAAAAPELASAARRGDGPTLTVDGLPGALVDAASGTAGAEPLAGRPLPQRVVHPLSTAEQYARLRATLGQLIAGLQAIHRAGYAHCDVKHSNVLVTAEGRVVLLDYGLVTDVDPSQLRRQGRKGELSGTPLYMAPEQFHGQRPSAASDLYATGVLLYLTLTGCAPFTGTPRDLGEQKTLIDPLRPQALSATVPQGLDALCMDLLRRDPAARPTADEALARLGREGERRRDPISVPVLTELLGELLGREEELAVLGRAFSEVIAGRPATILVHGGAGVGKSALVATFRQQVEAAAQAVVLAGRCYERETVPYKALDALFDALAIFLLREPPQQVAGWLPQGVGILARMFPVLEQVPAIREAAPVPEALRDPRAFRRQAVVVMRELWRRLSRQRPLVLAIDDVQWGDRDSGLLLADLLDSPDPPPLLLLLSYRTAEGRKNPLLGALGTPLQAASELALGPLEVMQAQAIASRILGPQAGPELAQRIAIESGGNAYFVGALAYHVRSHSGVTAAQGLSHVRLEDVVVEQVSALPPAAQRVLEAVAVAAEPLPQSVLQQAAELEGEAAYDALILLRTQRLVRTEGLRRTDLIEAYHDRVREVIWARLSAETLRQHHRRLAWAFVNSGQGDPAVLARHFDGAGDAERARPAYVEAGRRAVRALAFDRATEHFGRALALHASSAAVPVALRVAYAEALANAGYGPRAAQAYLQAVAGADPALALEYRQRAALIMLDYGHIAEGRATLQQVLTEHQIAGLAAGRVGRARMLLRRAQLRLRGLRFKEREPQTIAPERLHRIDVLWSVGLGHVLVDTVPLTEYNTLALIEALNVGDLPRITRSLALELTVSGMRGRKALARNRRLIAMAQALSERVDDPYIRGLVAYGTAVVHVQMWDHQASLPWMDLACDLLRNRCVGHGADANRAEVSRIINYCFLGKLALLRAAVREALRDAEKYGERQLATSLRGGVQATYWLLDDDVEGARRARQELWDLWPHGSGFLRHYWDAYSRVAIDLYAGDGRRAWQQVEEHRAVLFHPALERIALGRLGRTELTARAALAAAAATPGDRARARVLAAAERLAQRLADERLAAPSAVARLVRSRVLELRGQGEAALEELQAAEDALAAQSFALHAMAARRRRGALLGGAAGQALRDQADAWLREQTVVHPGRFARFWAPH